MTSEQQLSNAFLVARDAEASLRLAVRTDLGRAYGPLWHSRVPQDMASRWEGVQQQEKEAVGYVRSPELLDYATVDEVAGLINRFAEVFDPRFGKVESIQGKITEFRMLRNMLMHGADLTEGNCLRLLDLAGELIDQCTAEVKSRSGSQEVSVKCEPSSRPRPTTPLTPGQNKLLRVVNQATAQMSGLLTGERQALVDYIEKNLPQCTSEALAQILDKFAAISGTASLVDKLLLELAPVRPPRPQHDWKLAQWLNWASRFYMPYKRWLIRQQLDDAEIEEMALAYEDWLRQSYPEFLLGEHDQLVVGSYKYVKQQLASGMRVLWLVIDNLCGLWLPEFIEILNSAGIRITDTRRMLALLPSATSISRLSLLSGRLPTEASRFIDEETACRQLWSEQGVSHIAFCTSVQVAERAVGQKVDLIILVDNWLDTLAHQSEQPGFDREEQMVLTMGRLAMKVGNILRKMSSIGPTRLIISTDHGATYPSPMSQIVDLPSSALIDNDLERHRRFSGVKNIAGLNSVDWHTLEAEAFCLPQTYAVARGQRYIGMRPKAYTHGGLSPEETVVRLIVADTGEREPLELVLSQATPPLRLGRPSRLAILVRNPFDVPIENLEISLLDLHVRFDPIDVPARSEAQTSEQEITLPAKLQIEHEVGYIRVTGQYQISGRLALVQTQQLRVNVRELYRSSLDDFEDMLND